MKTLNFFLKIILPVVLLSTSGCEKHRLDKYAGTNSKVTPHDILSADKYTELVVEIAYEGNHPPNPDAINIFKSFVAGHVYKPDGISFEYNPIPDQGKLHYSIDDVNALELKYRKNLPRRKKLSIFIFYANAPYGGDTDSQKILGAAYGGSSFVVFGYTTQQYSGGLTQPEQKVLEATVFNHEMAHLYGLVNYGSEMVTNHQDMAHGHHCSNENCIMHYAAETSDIVANLVGANVPELDQNCIDDIRNNGGK